MTTFTRRVNFTAFQFNATPNLTEYGVREMLAMDVPDLSIYDVALTEGSNRNDPFLEREPVLQIVQYRLVEGERCNVQHELRSGEWLIEDVFDEEGWRVVSAAELLGIMA